MSKDWIGCVVSVHCGSSLGHFQGQVTAINEGEQTVTLNKPYQNGKKCQVDKVIICASDIEDLQIIRSRDEADDIVNIPTVPMVLSEETKKAVLPKCPSPVKIVHATMTATPGFGDGHKGGGGRHYASNFSGGVSPAKFRQDLGGNGRQGHSSPHADRNEMQSPEKEFRSRKNSDGGNKRGEGRARKGTTPKKIEGRKNNQTHAAFSLPTECIMGEGEFDFEKSNLMFDKRAEFKKIENGFDFDRPAEKPSKYRHDENVLSAQPTDLRQIRVPGDCDSEYYTDLGLVVPSITQDMRSRLMESAEQFGFTPERLIEQYSRSAAEMAMQLLGGNCRWVPTNDHQRPVVVFLCGPHLQGALGVNCARHLANHGAKVVVFSPVFMRMNPLLETELKLLESTSALRVSTSKDLPVGSIDLVVNALDNHEHSHLRGQSWFEGAVVWARGQRARCLALDPPQEGPALSANWSLGLILPLALPASCGQQYLCDVGVPGAVFTRLGIDYSSPFSHKFFVALNAAAPK